MAQGVSGGVKGGVSFSTLSADSSENVDLDSRTGIVAGAFVTWPIAEHVGLQLEGLYAQKGAAFDQSGVTGTTKLDYFEVPLLAGRVHGPVAFGRNIPPVLRRTVDRLQGQREGQRLVPGADGRCRYSRRGYRGRRLGCGGWRGRDIRPHFGRRPLHVWSEQRQRRPERPDQSEESSAAVLAGFRF